jgi:hypothetical protein
MAPLFACAGCGVQIERSARSYLQRRGRVLCSTCLDRLDDAGHHPSGPEREVAPERKADTGERLRR